MGIELLEVKPAALADEGREPKAERAGWGVEGDHEESICKEAFRWGSRWKKCSIKNLHNIVNFEHYAFKIIS